MYKVTEKNKPQAIHLITWSKERGLAWIEKYGDSKIFMDKTLTKKSFKVVKDTKDE